MKCGKALQAVVVLTILLLMSGSGWAEVPSIISFQGVLTDNAGIPLEGNQLVNFSIYDDAAADTAVWSEQQAVYVTGGVFNVLLGTVVPLDVSDFATASLFLEIQVFTAGPGWETLSPRQILTSTAFAMRAGDADTLSGFGEAEFARADHAHDDRYVNTDEADAIGSAMVADNSLGAADLAENAVGASELANNAVDTTAIVDGAITGAKIADGSIGSADIADNSLTAADLAPGSVGTSEVANNTLTADDLGTDAVTNDELADNAVEGDNILDGSIKAADLADDYVNVTGDTMTGALTVQGNFFLGTGTGDDNDVLYMDYSTSEYLMWEDGQTRFRLSDALNLMSGSLAVGGHTVQPSYNSLGTEKPTSGFMAGANDLFVGDDIESGSDIFATGDFRYASAKTFYLNLPAAAFNRNGLSDETWVVDLERAWIWVGSGTAPYTVQVTAPVYLPQGAAVTEFRLFYYDDTWVAGEISGSLNRVRTTSTRSIVQMAAIATTATVGDSNEIKYLEDSTISYAVIDNRDYQYTAYVTFTTPAAGVNEAISFYGARVEYTLQTLMP